MLHVNDLTYRIGGRVLLEDATLHLPDGHRAGLVGRNGAGKTTLFRLILGDLSPDAGGLSIRPRARVGTVAQEVPSGPESLIDTVLAADTERSALLVEAESATDPERISDIHTRLADIDAHTAPARAASILAGLGFDEAAQARPCSDFSGGWRMRVALAAALFSAPDFLLLDEPTNHLDLEATLWLTSHLANWPGTLLVISHDRDLLNQVVGEIVHLEQCRLVRYQGGYDRFERTRAEAQVLQAKLRSKQLDERRRIESFVERFRAKATKARQAQSRLKMLARMEPIATVIEERTVSFDFPQPDPLSPPLIALEKAAVGYTPGAPILKRLELRIDMDDRIALLGANGNGKSTLIKLLSDRLKPEDGKLRKSSKLKIGYFAQHQADELSLAATPVEVTQQRLPMATETKVRAHLGRFGFGADKADTKIGNLSGGEKARLLFALMSLEAPHVLLLDEPTNHLDVDSREALVQALNAYDGAVVLVSHDSHLIELVADRLWLVEDGSCREFEGDLGDYRTHLADRRKGANRDRTTSSEDRKQARRDRAAARAETAPLRKAAKEAEKRMEKLEAEKAKVEAALAKPSLYDGPPEKVTALQIKLGGVVSELEAAEEAWLEAQEALEQLT
ncbi:MAG: ABC-F family ATP-binding cassette domain-containing protein [Magnetovibrionaceae bacterium]